MDEQEMPLNATLLETPPLRVYKWRWVCLVCLCILGVTNGMAGQAFAPISSLMQRYYGLGTTMINLLTVPYAIAPPLLNFPASRVLDLRGLYFATVLATAGQALGMCLRALPENVFDVSQTSNYVIVLCGQVVIASSTCFVLSSAPKLSAQWFAVEERATATAVASVSNPLGMAAGFAFAPLVVSQPEDAPRWTLLQAIMGVLVLVIIASLLRDTPPTPPSYSALDRQQRPPLHWKKIMVDLLTNRGYVFLVLSFGIGMGTFNTLAALLNQILTPEHYTERQVGIAGVFLVVPGIIAAILMGKLMDVTQRYLLALRSSIGLASLVLCVFGLVLGPGRFGALAALIGAVGFFGMSSLPVALELAIEITYPIPEGAATAILMGSGALFNFIFIFLLDVLKGPGKHMYYAMYTTMAILLCCWIGTLFVSGSCRRIKLEDAHGKGENDDTVALDTPTSCE